MHGPAGLANASKYSSADATWECVSSLQELDLTSKNGARVPGAKSPEGSVMQEQNIGAEPRAVKLVPCPCLSSFVPTTSTFATTMSSTPLMKSEGRASDDDYSDSGQIPLNHRRSQLLRKENIGWACLFAVLLAVTIGLSAGVAVVVVLSWQNRGPAFSQSFAPSPITRDVDITFHETRFDGNFMEENIYRRKGNNETDAAWAALGIDCK